MPLNLQWKSCHISVLVSQHPSWAHQVLRVITLGEWLSRCEGCGWDSGGSPCPWVTGGACSVSAASVQHLWTEWRPTCSQISAVWVLLFWLFGCFGIFLAVPPASLSPRSAQLHEKAPAKPFSPSTSWKSSLVSSILISYLRHRLTWTPAPTASLNILNLASPPTLRLGAQAPLADGKTHRWFIIPSSLPLTKHWAHIWRLPLDPFILFRGPGTVAESDWYRLNSYPAYCEQPFVFMKSKYLPLRWASTAHRLEAEVLITPGNNTRSHFHLSFHLRISKPVTLCGDNQSSASATQDAVIAPGNEESLIF